jgi:glutathione S-transferase
MNTTLYFSYQYYCIMAKWALGEAGVPFETKTLERDARSYFSEPDHWFLQLSPASHLPVLVDNGAVLSDTAAILIHVGDKYGVSRRLWPAFESPLRGQALSWVAWAATDFFAARTLWFRHRPDMDGRSEKQYQEARVELAKQYEVLERRLAKQPYLLDDQFTFADVFAADIALRIGNYAKDPLLPPKTRDWVNRCMERPARKIAEERPK